MLNAAWLIVHLIASAMPGTAAAGQAGVTCSYQACMAKCSRLNGPVCNSYCDAKIPQRAIAGICASQDAGPIDDDMGK